MFHLKIKFTKNQKPVDLLQQCIEKSSDENDIVFDGFLGSGSTGVAALNLHRRFIGVELDKNYFDVAKNRIEKLDLEA